MNTLWLRIRAPFAAFRWMQAGVWRGTSPTIPYSTAWGLVLNVAGMETRAPAGGTTTLIRQDAPRLELAIGEVRQPERAVLYQQLHSYPVGTASSHLKERTRGAKYHILPVRRELLIGFEVILGVRAQDAKLGEAIVGGLRGEGPADRYGLPFAGDNNLLFDAIDLLDEPIPVRWWVPVDASASGQNNNCRLTIGIDRDDSSRTTTGLFAPSKAESAEPPSVAWVWTPRAA